MEEKTRQALVKKALGFTTEEIVEEYSQSDGEITLTKKKVTVKTVPPDCTAIKMLMEEGENYSQMSDQELEREKQRLLALLKEKGNDN